MKKLLLGLSALLLIYSGILGYWTHCTVNTMKELNRYIQNGDQISAISVSEKLSKNYSNVQSTLDIPIIRQALNVLGLNLTNNKDDYKSIIKATPYLTGVGGVQRYLVSFQNTAEARGTGGILGAFAILKIEKGRITIEKTGSNAALASLREIPVPVTDEFLNLYGKNPAILQNSNLSPHLPYGAEIWMGLWKKQTGQDLDGVIAVDPTALSYVLDSTGPIKVRNRNIDSKNLVSETLKDAYKRYEKDNDSRKQYLVEIMNATAKKLMSGQYSKYKMLKALNKGVSEGRILLYSRNKTAESYLSTTKFGSFLRENLNNEYRVVIQNIDASKLDYYLKKEIDIKTLSCGTPRKSTVTVKVTNTLESGKGLPAYVLTRADKGKPEDLVTGQHKFKVFIYGPVGSSIVSAWRENIKYGIGGQSRERMRPVMVMEVDLKPKQSERLQVNFAGGNGKLKFVDQPLVIPTIVNLKSAC